MHVRNGILYTPLILTFLAAVFPTPLLAIGTPNGLPPAADIGDPYLYAERPYPSFLTNIIVETQTSPEAQYNRVDSGTGAFISPNLVVTAAHVVSPRHGELNRRMRVSGVTNNGEIFEANVLEAHFASGYPVHFNADGSRPPVPGGSDVAVLLLDQSVLNIDHLRLPEEVGITISEQQELAGTVYGQRIPSRAVIAENYDRITSPEGRAFMARNPDRVRSIPSQIVLSGSIRNSEPLFHGAPFLPVQLQRNTQPRVGDNVFSGQTNTPVALNLDMGREDFINMAYSAALGIPFHGGDSGAPFVSVTATGETYLAGLVQSADSVRYANGTFRFISHVSTGNVSAILREMGQAGALNRGPSPRFWRDRYGHVARSGNQQNNDISPLEPANETRPLEQFEPCDLSDSDFCRYWQTMEYHITPVAIRVDAPDGLSYPNFDASHSEYRIYGQINFFSPEDEEDLTGQVLDVPSSTPRRLPLEYSDTSESDSVPLGSATGATITANMTDPMICLSTPSESGVSSTAVVRHYSIVPGGTTTCTVLNETNRNVSGTYDAHLEGPGGNIIVELDVQASFGDTPSVLE
ncbi:hypothetical protein ACEK07_15370 [Alcanivoracaceae bacterium MT1]